MSSTEEEAGQRKKRRWDQVTPEAATNAETSTASGSTTATSSGAALAATRLNALKEKFSSSTHKEPASELPLKEIEINNCSAAVRYRLTKGDTHKEIHEATGATVTTRGRYIPPSESAGPDERPLFLRITAPTEAQLEAAVNSIETMMQPQSFHKERPGTLSAKVMVEIDPDPSFNLVGKIIGPKGAFVKHIESTSKARVQLKGRGRLDQKGAPSDDKDSEEPMHLLLMASSQEELDAAKKLAEDLIKHVREDYEEFKSRRTPKPPPYLPAAAPPFYPPPPPGPYPSHHQPPPPHSPLPHAPPPYTAVFPPPYYPPPYAYAPYGTPPGQGYPPYPPYPVPSHPQSNSQLSSASTAATASTSAPPTQEQTEEQSATENKLEGQSPSQTKKRRFQENPPPPTDQQQPPTSALSSTAAHLSSASSLSQAAQMNGNTGKSWPATRPEHQGIPLSFGPS
ncbi:putative myelin transcription factor 1-like protein (Fragment), variant 2 [Balamuthia mandrillaris]